MARKRELDTSGFEPVGDEFNNRSDSDGIGASGSGSGGAGRDGSGDGSDIRYDEPAASGNSDGSSEPESDVNPGGSGGGSGVRFSVGNAIFGNKHGSGSGSDGDDNRVSDGGDGTRSGEVGTSAKRTRKAARAALADEPSEEEGSPVSKGKKKASTVGAKKLTQTEAAEVAEGLLDMGGFIVAKIVENDEAEFTDDEKDDIIPGLTRIMLRMSPAAAKRYRDLTDPFMLILAFYFYAARVAPMYQEKRYRDAYERAQYAEQYGFGTAADSVDNPSGSPGTDPQNPTKGVDRRGSILR